VDGDVKARRLFYFCGAFASRLLRSPLENRLEHRPIRDSLEFAECRGYETSTAMILARFETTNTKFIAPTANPRNTETSPAQIRAAQFLTQFRIPFRDYSADAGSFRKIFRVGDPSLIRRVEGRREILLARSKVEGDTILFERLLVRRD